jgi:hypothetical protein
MHQEVDMSLRKLWFGKKAAASDETREESVPERRIELRDAWAAFDASDFDAAIASARPFLGVGDAILARQSCKLVALSEFRKKNFTEALVLFQGIASVSTDAGDWFNVITAGALAGEIPTAEHAFEVAIQCQAACNHSQQPSIPFMRYYFGCALRDRLYYDKAFRQIEELRAIYEEFRITDDNFLHMRGVPFLSQSMSLAMDVLRGLGDSIDPVAWLGNFGGRLDKDGESYLVGLKSEFENPG